MTQYPWRRSRHKRGSRLGRRILLLHIAVLAVLFLGVFYLGRYQEELAAGEVAALRVQTEIYATMLGEMAAAETDSFRTEMDTETTLRLLKRLSVADPETRIQLYDTNGRLIGDSHGLVGLGDPQVVLLEWGTTPRGLAAWLNWIQQEAPRLYRNLLPSRSVLPQLPQAVIGQLAAEALEGQRRAGAWRDEEGRVHFVAAAPVQRYRMVRASLVLVRDDTQLDTALRSVALGLAQLFVLALVMMVLLSIIMTRWLVRPLRRLALAADAVRRGRRQPNGTLPDYASRQDEIGDLSLSLRAMTAELQRRMEATESFAADVSHELKTPLTSLKSALETLRRLEGADSEADQEKMMQIALSDVERLNKLITDIASASRLDAVMAREKMGRLDFAALLREMVIARQSLPSPSQVRLILQGADQPLYVMGHADRLAQIITNLIENALSFSPEGGEITLTVTKQGWQIETTIQDEGPGLPEGAQEKIFERFYSERHSTPTPENRHHSGLGLAISRQIATIHGGTLTASNRPDGKTGALFTLRLPRAGG